MRFGYECCNLTLNFSWEETLREVQHAWEQNLYSTRKTSILRKNLKLTSLRSMTLRPPWIPNAPKRQYSCPFMCPNFIHLDVCSLEALEIFIQNQRILLEQTQTDITRLQRLRSDVIAQPDSFVSDLSNRVSVVLSAMFSSSIYLSLVLVRRQIFSP
jgi:hypothetical protein